MFGILLRLLSSDKKHLEQTIIINGKPRKIFKCRDLLELLVVEDQSLPHLQRLQYLITELEWCLI